MHYFSIFALVPLYVSIVHAGITAFSGSSCDGNVGNNVPCDGSCHAFDDRHSFRVDSGTGTHCVTMFAAAGCPSGQQTFTFTGQNGQCTNVNTGTNVRSFLCAPNNNCLRPAVASDSLLSAGTTTTMYYVLWLFLRVAGQSVYNEAIQMLLNYDADLILFGAGAVSPRQTLSEPTDKRDRRPHYKLQA
ncbi:hypothetical protein C8Q74DRAFT_1220412 [Fomes fomentarius]|nr:hypothetical protein C8Q74DRAFT_1220412 [Fomes fomentarius]